MLGKALEGAALFLDIDGTLLDIAATPDSVVVPAGLTSTLAAVAHRLDGALGIITGRPIADVDRYLTALSPIAAGTHGAELRAQVGGPIAFAATRIDDDVVASVQALARSVAGTLVELKQVSVALHYRNAVGAETRLEEALRDILARGPDHLVLSRGRKVFEIVPRHVSKGTALRALMALPVFAGRRPIMIGDDASDLSAFEAAISLGGRAFKVGGEFFDPSEANFPDPAAVRSWLSRQIGEPV